MISKHNRRLILVLSTLLSITFIHATTARAEDREFNAISTHLKARYQAKRKRVPFLGLASFAVKIVRPAGVKSIKLVMFEELNAAGRASHAELSAVIREALDEQWQPLVRIFSRTSGEQMFVYARQEGEDVKLMVVSLQETEAFIARVKLSPATLAKWMEKPELLGVSLAGHN